MLALNTENYEAMKEYLGDAEWCGLQDSVVVTLRGDKPENKLLGVQLPPETGTPTTRSQPSSLRRIPG